MEESPYPATSNAGATSNTGELLLRMMQNVRKSNKLISFLSSSVMR